MNRCWLFFALLLPPSASGEEPELEPVRRWIAHQASVRTVRAEFVQERQLRSLKAPLRHPGKFWFAAPGSFRWELGEPAQTVVVQRGDEDLLILRTARREALRIGREGLAEKGGSRAVALMASGFPRDYETFARDITITEVAREGADYQFTGRLNDRRASLALRKIIFTVNAENLQLRRFYLRFRDGSSISTHFTEVRENAEVPASRFEVDLAGFTLKSD